jgi:hypothetical protein
MHMEHRFHFDNVRVLLSRLQHDQITVCNRSVALPRPLRPECNNRGFPDERLLSEQPAGPGLTSDRGAEVFSRNANARAPQGFWGARGFCVCSAVSYFSTRVGSIIGAGRLSFRVRDGSGRFPVAVAAVTLFTLCWWWGAVVCAAGLWLRVCKFSAG